MSISTSIIYTSDFYFHLIENNLTCGVLNLQSSTFKSISDPTLIDCRSPVPSGKPRATEHIRRPLIQYSHVQPCSRLPVRQTVCLACVSISGHLQFYATLSDQSVLLALTGHRTACCVQAALSGHVWTIQHGCHRSIPGVCSRWLMAFTLEPRILQSRKQADLDCSAVWRCQRAYRHADGIYSCPQKCSVLATKA